MKDVMESLSVLSQSQMPPVSKPSAGFTILTKSGNVLKRLTVRTGNVKDTPITRKERPRTNSKMTTINSKTAEEYMSDVDNNYDASPGGFDDYPVGDDYSEDDDALSLTTELDPKIRKTFLHDDSIISTVKSRKRKKLTDINEFGTADNVHSDPDYSGHEVLQESDSSDPESDSDYKGPRSSGRREEGNDSLLCEEVEYSVNDYGIFLCGSCHYSCTHIELLRHHIKKSHKEKEDMNIAAIENSQVDPVNSDISTSDIQQTISTKPKLFKHRIISKSGRHRLHLNRTENKLTCEGIKYTKNSSGLLLCSLCHHISTSIESLKSHMNKSHIGTDGQANNNPEFKIDPSLIKIVYKKYDYTTDEVNGKSECSTCNKSFDSREEVIQHIQKDHIAPDNASTSFGEKHVYKNFDYLMDEKTGNCKCCTCKKIFGSVTGVMLHIKRKHVSPAGECGLDDDENLPKDDNKEGNYKGFKYTNSPGIGSKMKCNTCKKRFHTKDNLFRHITVAHIKEKLEVEVKTGEKVKKLDSGNWMYENVEFSKDKSTGQLVCSHCNQMYVSLGAIQYHIRNSKVDNRRKKSNKRFSTRVGYNKWRIGNIKFRKDDTTGKYTCGLCNKVYNSRQVVTNHIRFIHLGSKTDSGTTAMTLHGKPRKVYPGPITETAKKISDGKWVYKDIEILKDESTAEFTCGLCNSKYKSKEMVKKHILYIHCLLSENGRSLFTAHGTPRKKFFNPEDLLKKVSYGKWLYRGVEITKDESTNKFACSKCDNAYRSIQTTKNHIKYIHLASKDSQGRTLMTLHGSERKPHANEIINLGGGKFCWREVEYTLTKVEGSELKLFHCLSCGHQVSVKSRSTGHCHIRYRHLEKKFECETCGNKYICGRELERHKLSHEPEGTFQCDQCGVVTRSLGALSAHKQNVHEKIRTCVCHYCGKAFFRKKDCSTHIRTHTREKPFKCDKCNSSFSIKVSLKKHILSHHQ